MQTKYTEATHNRPAGDRVIDAPFVFADLDKYASQLKTEDAWEKSDRNSITIYKTEGLAMVLICLHKNATIEDNSVDGLLTVEVLEGSVDLAIENHIQVVKKNQLMTLHPCIRHSIRARKETTILLVNQAEESASANNDTSATIFKKNKN